MATIVTRAGKGSALTHTEGDANFTNLNNDKMESFTLAGDSGTSQTIQGGNTLTIAGGTGLSSVASATDTVTINLDNTAVTPASYTNANITVDAQGRITAASNGSTFAPASPGEIGASTPDIGNFTDLKVKAASSTVKELQLYDQDNSNYVGFKAPTNVGSNRIYVMPSTDGTNGHFLRTDGSGNLSWAAAGGGGNLDDLTDVTITSPVNTQVLSYNNGIWSNSTPSTFNQASPGEIGATTPDVGNFTNLKVKASASTVRELQLHDQDNSNYVGFKSPTTVSANIVWTLPSSDGTATQVLQTNGSGALSWVSQSTFAPASPGEIGATTPDVGNFTDLKVKSASSTVKELQLHDQDNSNYVGFKAPVTVSSNKVWVLPSTDGTNGQVLSTNGSATLSWATAGGSRSVAILRDTFANNSYSLVDGTNTLEASWTEVSDTDSLISTSTHSFTLVAGTYYFQFRSPSLYGRADAVGAALVPMFRLKNTTDTTIMAGSPDNMRYYVTSTTADTLVGPVSFNTYFTIAGTKTFQIEYEQATNTNAKWANGESTWTQRSQWWIFITKF